MLINLRNALMTGKRLPYDAEVEYLESTGTQWIDTGIPVSSTIGVRIDFEFANSATEQILFGALDVGVTRYAPFWKGRETFYWTSSINGSADGIYGSADFNRHVILNNFQNDGNAVIDGVLKGTSINRPSAQGPTNFLFARNYSSKYACFCKVYGCKVSVGSLVVRDFIPVRVGTVGYLYDRVTRNLFGNEGAGDFVLGQDVIDIAWVDGEYYGQNGSIGYNTNLARIDDYIAVTGGHSITWKWGDSVLGTCYLIVYNAQKQQIDFWSPNSSAGERTINLNATGAFVRYSIGKNFKNTTFFKDNTTGLYAVRNGKILLP